MIIRTCKYCKKDLKFEKGQQFGAHIRNCIDNPSRLEINKKAYQSLLKTLELKRRTYNFKCIKCGAPYKVIMTERRYKSGYYRKTCSKSCANRRITKLCINCGKNWVKKAASKFCSMECNREYNYKERIRKWKADELCGSMNGCVTTYVRRYLFEKYNNQCAECGWDKVNKYTGKPPLNIHHIDGNSDNTVEENLILLCPNCHSLTEFYGGLNRGHGRELRRIKRREKNNNL